MNKYYEALHAALSSGAATSNVAAEMAGTCPSNARRVISESTDLYILLAKNKKAARLKKAKRKVKVVNEARAAGCDHWDKVRAETGISSSAFHKAKNLILESENV